MLDYHMNRSEQEITDQEQLTIILEKGIYTVVALSDENKPYIVTLNYGYDKDRNSLYFHTAFKGLKVDILNKNSIACATVIEDRGYLMDECDHSYRSVVLTGKIHTVDSLDEKKHGMDIMINQLENDPVTVKKRLLKNEKRYHKVNILRMDIEELTGKESK